MKYFIRSFLTTLIILIIFLMVFFSFIPAGKDILDNLIAPHLNEEITEVKKENSETSIPVEDDEAEYILPLTPDPENP